MKFALTAIYPSEQFRSKHLFPVYIVYLIVKQISVAFFSVVNAFIFSNLTL